LEANRGLCIIFVPGHRAFSLSFDLFKLASYQ
jgi:hypothetical protein